MVEERKKAFIGAAINLVTNVVGGAIKNAKAKKAAQEQERIRIAENVNNETYQQANALQSMYNNTSDEFIEDKISLKNGGKINMDRIKRAKIYACGGRKKLEDGGFIDSSKYSNILNQSAVQQNNNKIIPVNTSNNDSNFGFKVGNFLNNGIGAGVINGIGNITSALMYKPVVQKPIKKSIGFNYGTPKTTITPNSYDNVAAQQANFANSQFNYRLAQERFTYRCGGKSKRK